VSLELLPAQGPVDVIVGRLFGMTIPVRSDHWKAEFSKAEPGPVFRLCATIYNPTNPGPYNDDTWDTKIAAVVLFGRAVLSARIRRMTPNVK
jgi:hypothetical protein